MLFNNWTWDNAENAHDGRIKIGITAALSRFFDLTKHISSLEEILGTEIGLLGRWFERNHKGNYFEQIRYRFIWNE